MTEKRNYTTNTLIKNDNLKIPSREEFHKFTSNELSEGDFCTNYSSGYQINRVENALKWTIKNASQQRSNNYKE